VTVDWRGIALAVVGGDGREPVIAGLAAATGADVRGYGLPWPDGGFRGVAVASSVAEAMRGARYAVLPIPRGLDGHLYAPAAPEPIPIVPALFTGMEPDAAVFCGRATDVLTAAADGAGVTLHEIDPDRELMLERAPAIVEGVLELTIRHTDVTINDADVAVVGHGQIGSLLARRLLALGAQVWVAARNPIQRASAYADGCRAVPLEALPGLAPSLAMLFSAVPARVVGRDVLERLPRGALVLDIAPAPLHLDFDLASHLGLRPVWARGMGKRAPITVGRSQWQGVRRRIEQLESRRSTR
jgi:dipicolinate synthase subunit A